MSTRNLIQVWVTIIFILSTQWGNVIVWWQLTYQRASITNDEIDRSFIVKSKHLQWCRDNFLVHQIKAKLFPIDLKNNWWQVFISLFILIVNAVYVNCVGRLTNRHFYSIEVACISILHNIRYYGVLGWNKA